MEPTLSISASVLPPIVFSEIAPPMAPVMFVLLPAATETAPPSAYA